MIKMKSTITAVAAVAALGLTGCGTNEPTLGTRLQDRGQTYTALGEKWESGRERIEEGRELVNEGQDQIESGQQKVRRGTEMINEGREDVLQVETRLGYQP